MREEPKAVTQTRQFLGNGAKGCQCERGEKKRKEKEKGYHLEIVQSRQPGIFVERRILCLGESLLHQF